MSLPIGRVRVEISLFRRSVEVVILWELRGVRKGEGGERVKGEARGRERTRTRSFILVCGDWGWSCG